MTGMMAPLPGLNGAADAGADFDVANGVAEKGGADFASVLPGLVFTAADFDAGGVVAGGGTIVTAPLSVPVVVGLTAATTGAFTSVCAGRVLR